MNAAGDSSGRVSRRKFAPKPELPCADLLMKSTAPTSPTETPVVSRAMPNQGTVSSPSQQSGFVDPAASLGPPASTQRPLVLPKPATYSDEVANLLARFHDRGWLPRSFSGDAAAAAAVALASTNVAESHRQAAAHLYSVQMTISLMAKVSHTAAD